MTTAEACTIEIIERTDNPHPSVIIPNEIRINGRSVLAPADHPVRVHEVSVSADEAVLVTLTLFAKRITVASESKGGER